MECKQESLLQEETYYKSNEVYKELGYSKHQNLLKRIRELIKDYPNEFIESYYIARRGKKQPSYLISPKGMEVFKDANAPEGYYKSNEIYKELGYPEHYKIRAKIKELLKDYPNEFIESTYLAVSGRICPNYLISPKGAEMLDKTGGLIPEGYCVSNEIYEELGYSEHVNLCKKIKRLLKDYPNEFIESTYLAVSGNTYLNYLISPKGVEILKYTGETAPEGYYKSNDIWKETGYSSHSTLCKSIKRLLKDYPNEFIESTFINERGFEFLNYFISSKGLDILKKHKKDITKPEMLGKFVEPITVNTPFGAVMTATIKEETYYRVFDLVAIFNYKTNTTDTVKNFNLRRKVVNFEGFSTKHLVVDKNDLYSMIATNTTRTQEEKIALMEALGLDTDKVIITGDRPEIAFVDKLERTLRPLNIKGERQYSVLNYRIDYYIPSLKIAVEYDENDHKFYPYEAQELRQKRIEKELGCKFIRLSDKEDDFYNVGLVMKEISLAITREVISEIKRA